MEFSVCGECDRGKDYSRECVYCLLFGIMIHRNHRGCKYHKTGVGANGTTEGAKPEANLAAGGRM